MDAEAPVGRETLIITDDAATRAILARVLAAGGNATYEAASAAEAQDRMHTQTPDLVLLDFELSDGSGLDLAREILDEGFGVPAILISGDDDPRAALSALDLDAGGYLTKPITAGAVLAAVYGARRHHTRERTNRETLERQRRQLSEAETVAGLGSWEWDIADDTREWSDEMRRIYGVELDARLDFETSFALIHPDDGAQVQATVQAALASHESFSAEYRIVRADGGVRVIHSHGEVVGDEDGEPVRMLGTTQDITERRAAEREQARLTALVDSTHEAIISKGLDGTIESWNRGAHELYGYTAEEAVGRSVAMLFPPDHEDELNYILGQINRGDHIGPMETVRIKKSGERVEVSLRIAPLHDADGGIVGASTTSGDITHRRLLEARLRTNSRYFELSSDLTAAAGPDGYFVNVNHAVEEMLGWTVEEFCTVPFIELVHPDDRAATLAEVERLHAGPATVNFVNRYAAKDGTYRWLDWNAVVPPDEPLIYCSGRDITDRKRAEAALSVSNRRTREILETAHDAFVAIDGRGMITDWNRQAEVMFGWSRADAVGRDLSETIIPAEHREPHRRGLQRFVAGGDSRMLGKLIEFSAVHRNGHEFPVEITVSPVETEQGYSFNAFLRDITDRRRAQEELALARDRALEASRMKSMFVANVSHEIRTPMNGVLGMAELLLDTGLDDDQRAYAEMISSSGETLLEVIDDILDFSKIEAGKLELDPTDFDLRDAIEKTCGMQADRAHKKGLELVVEIDADLPALLHGDVARLRQVVANFVSNAIKFTAEGEVVVRARSTASDGAELVHIEVEDTGIGIRPEDLEQLFKPFAQADSSTTRKYGGTGLGLAISKQLIELMGGRFDADSEPGKGSRFWFELSFAQCAAAERVPAEQRALIGVNVLVVDDNATSRRLLERQLSAWQMTCAVAENAAAALALMESAAGAGMPYTLALIDRNMPDMDGYALARAIRARRTLAGTRLVLLSTSVGRPEDLDDFALFDRDLTKPVRQSRLYGELKALIAGESPPVYRVQTESADVSPASLDERPEILVVEDTPVNQLVAARMLEKCGFRARVAENGLEALQALAERPYAAVLMDCQMPELDGYEATAAIRDDERDGRHIPIIAMTANSMRGERERCLAAGMDDYLTKPLRSQTLKHALKRWVRDPQTPQMSQQDSEPVENGTDPAAYPALLDEGLIDDLGFDEAGLNKLFSMYFNQATGQVSELSEAISRGETDVLAKTTHQLKGSSATIGAARVSYLAAELEATAKADQLEVAPEILDRLRCGLADTTVAVAARRSAIAVLDRA